MKYYSEKLDKIFTTEEELTEAETLATKKEEEKKNNELVTKRQKKLLARRIDEAEEALSTAYTEYHKVAREANKVIEEAKQKAKEMLKPAEEAVKEAEKNKWKALTDFNEKYGSYTKVYTGNEALKQLNESINFFNSIFDNLWL